MFDDFSGCLLIEKIVFTHDNNWFTSWNPKIYGKTLISQLFALTKLKNKVNNKYLKIMNQDNSPFVFVHLSSLCVNHN